MNALARVATVDLSPGVQRVAFDTETHPITAGCLAPRMVCLSAARRSTSKVGDITSEVGDVETGLVLRPQGLKFLHAALARPDVTLIGHNLTYDFGVACAEDASLILPVFRAYLDGRAVCTMVKQELIDVAVGMRKWRRVGGKVSRATYGLADLVQLYHGRHLEKLDTWRLRYGLLDGIPVEMWPEEAQKYAIQDAAEALLLDEAQDREVLDFLGEPLPNQLEQQRAAWVLHLMSMWGLRAEEVAVDRFEDLCVSEIDKMHRRLYDTCVHCGDLEEDHDDVHCASLPRDPEGIAQGKGFENSGVFRKNRDGSFSRTMAAIRARVAHSLTKKGVDVPYTPTGLVQTDKEALQKTDDPWLHILAESLTFEKHLGQWGPVLRAAVYRPVVCRYTVCRETGRTSCSGSEGQEGTNVQNPPRKGEVRPAIVCRPETVMCSTDADTIELRAHAQNCLEIVGWSKMADALVEQARSGGPDLHLTLAAQLLGIDKYEAQRRMEAGDKEVEDARQFAKIPNFGFPGGLGTETFIAYAAAQLSREDFARWFYRDPRPGESLEKTALRNAKRIRETWFETFPENRVYFRLVGQQIEATKDAYKKGTVRQLMSGRVRGGVSFTAAANGYFQGRVADAMKEILFRLGWECYTGLCSTCWGTTKPHAEDCPVTHQASVDCVTGYECDVCPDCAGSGKSVLLGSRPIMFLHDEPILEHPEATAHERAERQQAIMVQVLNKWMPSIPCTSSAVLMRRWHKGAKPLKVDGRLVPVKPVEEVVGENPDGTKKKKVKWVRDDVPAVVIMPPPAPELAPLEMRLGGVTLSERLAAYEEAKARLVA